MKRFLAVTVLILFTIMACNLGVIEEVQVTGSPEVVVPAGNATIVLTEYFDIEEMLNDDEIEFDIEVKTGENDDEVPYTYLEVSEELYTFNFSEFGDFTEFLDLSELNIGNFDFGSIEVPAVTQNITDDLGINFGDFSDFTDVFDLSGLNFSGLDFGGDLSIPEISQDITDDLNVDFDILGFFDLNFPNTTVQINIPSEPGDAGPVPIDNASVSIKIDEENGFDFVNFSQGTLTLALTLDKTDTGLEVVITDAVITDDPNDLGSPVSIEADIPAEGVTLTGDGTVNLVFNLTSKKLSNEFYIVFTAEADDGNLGSENNIKINPSLSGQAISSVEGLVLDETESPDTPIAIEFEIPDDLVSAVVSDGEITITVTKPVSWTNIELTGTTFTLIQDNKNGAPSEFDSTTSDNINYVIDLDGLEISNDTSFSLTYEFFLKTPDGQKSTITSDSIAVVAQVEITGFSTLTVELAGLDEEQSFSFDAEFLDFVTQITFEEGDGGAAPKLSIELNNQLPFDLELEITSVLLKNGTEVLEFPIGSSIQTADLDNPVDLTGLNADVEGNVELLSITPRPKGYVNDTFTMSDVTTDGVYSLDILSVNLSDIESVTLDIDETATIDISFPAEDLPEDLVSAVIGNGFLEITITLPSNWDAEVIEGTVFTLKQGVEFEAVSTRDGTVFTIDLEGLTVSGDGTNLEFSYSFIIDGEIPANAVGELDVSAAININEFSEIVLDMPGLDIDEEVEIDAGFLDYVKSLTFTDDSPTLSFTVNNQLPFGIEIDLVITSEVLINEDDGKAELTFAQGNHTVDAPLNQIVDFSILKDSIDDGKVVLLNITGGPTGYADGKLTLNNVALGQTYQMSLAVDAIDISDIDFVTLDISFEENIEDAIDFSFLSDVLPDGVGLEGVTAQMNFSGVDDFSGTIILLAQYGPDVEKVVLPLLGTMEGDYTFNPNDYEGREFDPDNPIVIELDQIINDRAEQVEFAFLIVVPEFDVYLDAVPENLGVELDITVPLHFVVEEGGVLLDLEDNGGNLIDSEDDLLGRGGPDDQINELLAQIGFASLKFDLINTVGIRPEVRITHKEGFHKTIDFITGEHTLELTSQDIAHIIDEDHFPFNPEVKLYLKEGDHWIYHEGELELGVWLQVGLDIDYSIPLFK